VPRHTIVAAVAATALGMGLSGCGSAQTDQQYQAGVGANLRTGPVQLYNALAVANDDDTATVSVTVLNRTDRAIRLTSASGRLSNGKKVTATVSPAIIGANEAKSIGAAGSVILNSSNLSAGGYVKLTLNFSGGNHTTIDAPIVERTSMYDSVATGPGGQTTTPTPSAGTAGSSAATGTTAGSVPARR